MPEITHIVGSNVTSDMEGAISCALNVLTHFA